jgi:hypothetical protein
MENRVYRATGLALTLPDVPAFDEGMAVGKPIVVPIFNHRNVGHKQHARQNLKAYVNEHPHHAK